MSACTSSTNGLPSSYQAAKIDRSYLVFHKDRLREYKGRIKELEVELNMMTSEARMYKRERNFLLPLVIAMVLWIATA